MTGVALAATVCAMALASGTAAVASPLTGSQGQAGAARPPRSPLPMEGAITEPDWAEKPSAMDVARYYPPLAQLVWLSGQTRINCTVLASGQLSGCTVDSEKPSGIGFGQAALQLSSLFRMKPRLFDGQPVSGGTVRIPIRFQMQIAPLPSTADTGPPPTAAALALGRRISAVYKREAERAGFANSPTKMLRAALGAAGLTPTQTQLLDSLEAAETASHAEQDERRARLYAASLSEAQLAQVAAFLESPTGQALVAANTNVTKAQNADTPALMKAIGEDARARLCRKIACLPEDTPPPEQRQGAPGPRSP